MKSLFMKGSIGQIATTTLIGTAFVSAIVTTIASKIIGEVVSTPQTNAASVQTISNRLELLCNDYGQTVSRVDQNLQIIGKALKVTIVTGSNTINPCK